MVALSRLSEAMLRVLHERKGLMLERGIGYWITDADELLPVPPRATHAELARQIIDPAQLDDEQREAFTIDPNAFALSQGWSRVRIYPGQKTVYLDLGDGKRSAHRRATEALLDQLDLSGLTIKYTDEDGNYIS